MRTVNFADGYTLDQPPLTSGAVQESFGFENNVSVWTEVDGYFFDIGEVSSADITVEIERIVDEGTFRQVAAYSLWHDGIEWKLDKGLTSGAELLRESVSEGLSVQLRVNGATGNVEYRSSDVVTSVHSGKMKFATIRRKS